MEFDHYTIKVRDLSKSFTFYSEVLLLPEIENKTQKPHIKWFSIGKSQELHIVEGDAGHIKTTIGVHLAFRVHDLKPLIARLEKYNIPIHNSKGISGEITFRADGVHQVYFQDPDDYWIEVNDALA